MVLLTLSSYSVAIAQEINEPPAEEKPPATQEQDTPSAATEPPPAKQESHTEDHAVTRETKAVTQKTDAPSMYISLFTVQGFTLPTGTIAGDGEPTGILNTGSSLGVLYGYRFTTMHSAYLSVSWTRATLSTEYTYMSQAGRADLTASFVDIALAYRGFLSQFYYDGGLYFGIPAGSWSRKEALSGTVTETLMYDTLEERRQNAFGLQIGGGITLPVTTAMSLSTGLECRIPFSAVYSDPIGNKLGIAFCGLRISGDYAW